MTNDSRFSTKPAPSDATREERHALLANMLGAYSDGELPRETASQIDAHLLGCARCRRELDVHRALMRRMESDQLVRASPVLRERVARSLASAPLRVDEVAERSEHRVWQALSSRVRAATLLFAVLATALVAGALWRRDASRRGVAAAATVVPVSSVALFSAVIADYRRVTAQDLPGRARDLAAVRAALPFPVQPLSSDSLRLLAAWTTTLDAEPAAVLAYRWNDQLVLQYVVSEQQLFRPFEVRRVFAAGHPMGARDGAQSVLAWPAPSSGNLLVGDATPAQLALLHARRATH